MKTWWFTIEEESDDGQESSGYGYSYNPRGQNLHAENAFKVVSCADLVARLGEIREMPDDHWAEIGKLMAELERADG